MLGGILDLTTDANILTASKNHADNYTNINRAKKAEATLSVSAVVQDWRLVLLYCDILC